MKEKIKVIEIVFKKCPVCKKGTVEFITKKEMFIFNKQEIRCNKCNAKFQYEGKDNNDEDLYSLDLLESKEKNKYEDQTLLKSEWEKGISELDYCIKSNTLINLHIEDLNIILETGEQPHHQIRARFLEERAVRVSGGGAVRVVRGVYLSGSKSESHGELRTLDNGVLLLTNKRLIFNGDLRSTEYKLNKVISVEEYKDAVEIGVSNKQKVQIFVVDDPHKLTIYLRMAVKKAKNE